VAGLNSSLSEMAHGTARQPLIQQQSDHATSNL
jgi:hypothetical protein